MRSNLLKACGVAALAAGLLAAGPASAAMMSAGAEGNPMVGGKAMMADQTIVSNAVNSPDHTTLVAAVKAAGLVDTLSGAGPFTVFAPTNRAFEALPAGTVDTLLKPENKSKLQGVLTYHVVPGRMTSADLRKKIQSEGGEAKLKTANGEMLTASLNGLTNIVITDAKGRTADISTYDVFQSNGIIHVVDDVLLP